MLYRGIAKFNEVSGQIFTVEALTDESAKWAAAFLFAGFILDKDKEPEDIKFFSLRKIIKQGKDWSDPEEQCEDVLSFANPRIKGNKS